MTAATVAEIGHELRPEHRRRGFMDESQSAILDRAYDVLGRHGVEANPLATNEASTGPLLKLGFRKEGALRQLLGERAVDQWHLAMLEQQGPCRSVR
jgi:ribosomal-protein-alanine N-acetyltransferase